MTWTSSLTYDEWQARYDPHGIAESHAQFGIDDISRYVTGWIDGALERTEPVPDANDAYEYLSTIVENTAAGAEKERS